MMTDVAPVTISITPAKKSRLLRNSSCMEALLRLSSSGLAGRSSHTRYSRCHDHISWRLFAGCPAHSRPKDGVASLAYNRPKDGVASLAYSRPKDGVASLAYGRPKDG